MENTSYALHIAVGVLIAIAILSLVIFRWKQIGSLEKAKDEIVVVKNKSDFNKEFEAYNKGLMYGTDVLSCLNKAQNNNQKYVYSNYYGTDSPNIGADNRIEYFMNVKVKLNTPLYDKIEVYYKNSKGKYQKLVGGPNKSSGLKDNELTKNFKNELFSSSSGSETETVKFDIPTVDYYYFKNGKLYRENDSYISIMWKTGKSNLSLYDILTNKDGSGQIQTNVTKTDYSLLGGVDDKNSTDSQISDAAKLSALITTVSLKKQTVNNDRPLTNYNGGDWSYCTWTTSASDFKTRKFKCTGSKYDVNTGYIEELDFEEIK